MNNMNVYLGTEVKARGWNAKIMLAYYLAEYGFNVIVGPRDVTEKMALSDEGGVYIEKDFFHKRYVDFLRDLKKKKFLLYSYDEEGLIYQSDDFYIDSRTDVDTLNVLDKVFTWGKEENGLLVNAYPKIENKFIAVGNPRIDFITEDLVENIYKKEIKEIKNQYGRYILINSTYSVYGDPIGAAKDENEVYKTHTNKDVWSKYSQLMIDDYKWYDKLFDSLIDALMYISPLVDCKIIIRVHPCESMDKWKVLQSLDNVVVTDKYDALPWVYNAEMLIHSNCTTGVEAALMGKKVISYMPFRNYDEKHNLPNAVSFSVSNKEDLLSAIKDKKAVKTNVEKFISNYIELGRENNNSCAKISKIIAGDAKIFGIKSKNIYNENLFNNFKIQLHALKNNLKRIIKGMASNSNSKFPTETMEMFEKRARVIEKSLLMGKMKLVQISPNTFCISKK